jgi:hypothetical protein
VAMYIGYARRAEESNRGACAEDTRRGAAERHRINA